LGEALLIDDTRDVDFRAGELRLATLKKKRQKRKSKGAASDIPHPRQVPVPLSLTSEIATYQAEHPEMRGKVFKLQPGNFRLKFYDMAKRAKIPKELGHPHIMRHSRAVELLRGGVPINVVKEVLGHASILVTGIYLTISGQEARSILKDKGFL
jgi:molybdate transport system regulatory protein